MKVNFSYWGTVMALTAKSKAFAQAIADGMSKKDAAISAGYSEKTANQQGSKLSKLPEIIAYIEKLTSAKKLTPKSKKLTSEDEKLTFSKSEQGTTVQVITVEKTESGPEKTQGQSIGRDETPVESYEDPLEHLKAVWMDVREDPKLRLDAAKAAMPYIHGKVADKGKKETKTDEAKAAAKAGGKFGTLGSQLRS